MGVIKVAVGVDGAFGDKEKVIFVDCFIFKETLSNLSGDFFDE